MEQKVARYAHNVEVAGSIPAPVTMNDEKKDIEQYLADTIMGRPYGFSVGEQHFFLYPVTLGKMYVLQRQIEALQINQQNIQRDVSIEALRLVKEKKEECLTIICYHTCKTPQELFDNALISDRINTFEKELSEEDIAALMIMILTTDKTNIFIKYLGIDKEQDRMSAIVRIKERGNKNNITFGGKSVYGTLIDVACERYGWTKEYVVWGIDYTSLRLMLADKINSMYLTDDDLKKIPRHLLISSASTVKADDPKNREVIKNMNWK